jgi:hypothetical protein
MTDSEAAQNPTDRARGTADVLADRRSLGLGILLSLLASLPFWVADTPQLTDYPSHLARYVVMLDGGHDPWLARYYDFAWMVNGNLGADLLMWPLGRLFGPETAGWLLGMLIPVLTGLGLTAVSWVLYRRVGFGALLAFVTIWSPAMGMGFYNFCLSLALALLAFALWVRMEGRPLRWAVFLPIGLVVWLCHASGWGVLGILVFGYEWHRRKGVPAFLAPWPLFLPMVAQLLAPAAKGSLSFGANPLRYKSLVWLQALRDQDMVTDVFMLGAIVLAIGIALLCRRIDGRLGWAALLLALLTVVMPRHLGGGDYADYRLIAVALMIGALAINASPPRGIWLIAPLLFGWRLELTTAAWGANGRKADRILMALDHLPQGARVASAVLIEKRGWALDPFEHITSYATVRRSALTNSHFAIPGIHMLRLREGGPGFSDPSHRVFHDSHRPVDLLNFPPVRQADWLWYVGDRAPDRLPAGAVVTWRGQGTLVARLANVPAPR